jgi:hypothetical protein
MMIRRVAVLVLVVLVGLAAIPISASYATMQPSEKPPISAAKASCQEVVTRALDAAQNSCGSLSNDSACYASNKVTAESRGGPLKFDAVGDRVPLQSISRLVTSPLDAAQGLWGVSVLRMRANLPDTMPGQNVTVLVYGDTSIENVSGDMQAFYFTSGLGQTNCQEAPRDGIVVHSPQHAKATFTVNGVQITMASTVVLRAERNKSMSVQLVEGSASVVAAGVTQVLLPGQLVSVSLGGANGLTAVSAPSAPTIVVIEPVVITILNILIVSENATPTQTPNLTGTPTQTATPGPSPTATATLSGTPTSIPYTTIVIEGPVEQIDLTVNVIVVYGQKIRLRRDDPIRTRVKIGDWIRISGNFDHDENNQIIIIAVVVVIIDAPTVIIVAPGNPGRPANNGNDGHHHHDDDD